MMTKRRHATQTTATNTAPAKPLTAVTSIETITPKAAAEMLAHNTRNRALVQARVIALAEDMVAGRWRTTHQGIAIATDGTLLDGQHRLSAIVLADVSVTMMVTRGLAIETIDAVDVGERRRVHDVMAIADGVSLSTVQRATVIAAAQLAAEGSIARHNAKLTVNTLRAAWAEHGGDATAVLATLVNGKHHGRLTNAALTSALTIAHRTRAEKVIEFCEHLRSGANLSEGHPALLLRNYVTLSYVSGGSIQRDELNSRSFGLFESYVNGETRSRVQRCDAARARYLEPWAKRDEKGQ